MKIFIRILIAVAAALALIILIGTIFAFSRSGDSPPETYLPENTAINLSGGDTKVFSGLGRLRIPLSNSSVMILSIAFPYLAADTAFTEELAAKIGDFRTIAADYFSALPPEKIINIDEDAAKKEILRRYNADLRLGKINALYFSDMMIIDAAQ